MCPFALRMLLQMYNKIDDIKPDNHTIVYFYIPSNNQVFFLLALDTFHTMMMIIYINISIYQVVFVRHIRANKKKQNLRVAFARIYTDEQIVVVVMMDISDVINAQLRRINAIIKFVAVESITIAYSPIQNNNKKSVP